MKNEFIKLPDIIPERDLEVLQEGFIQETIEINNYKQIITIGQQKIKLSYENENFFEGYLEIFDESTKRVIFLSDRFFNKYNGQKFIDIDNRGDDELLLDLDYGASSNSFSTTIILDIKNRCIPQFKIENAEIIWLDIKNIFKVFVRVSPSALSASFHYLLEYKDLKLKVYFPEDDDSKKEILEEQLKTYYLVANFSNEELKSGDEINRKVFVMHVSALILQIYFLNKNINIDENFILKSILEDLKISIEKNILREELENILNEVTHYILYVQNRNYDIYD